MSDTSPPQPTTAVSSGAAHIALLHYASDARVDGDVGGPSVDLSPFDVTFDDSEFVFWLSSHNFSGAAKAAKTHGLSADDVSGCTPDDLIQLLGITRTEAHDVVVRFSQMRLILLLLSLDCLQSNAMRRTASTRSVTLTTHQFAPAQCRRHSLTVLYVLLSTPASHLARSACGSRTKGNFILSRIFPPPPPPPPPPPCQLASVLFATFSPCHHLLHRDDLIRAAETIFNLHFRF
jgi:hypothetical protein